MPTTTTNYSLYLYNSTTDQAESFLNFRLSLAGPGVDSNMAKIDAALGSHNTDITNLKTTRGAILVNAAYTSPNYYEAAGVSAITAYNTGMMIVLKLDQSSNGTATLNINSLGTKSLMKINSSGTPINLSGVDLIAGRYYLFMYDGTRWVWVTTSVDKSTIVIDSNGDIAHADTSTQASVNNTGATYIQGVTVDGMGHVTGLSSSALPTDNTSIIISANKIAHADTSAQGSVSNTGQTMIQSVTLDGMGHVTALASDTIPAIPTVASAADVDAGSDNTRWVSSYALTNATTNKIPGIYYPFASPFDLVTGGNPVGTYQYYINGYASGAVPASARAVMVMIGGRWADGSGYMNLTPHNNATQFVVGLAGNTTNLFATAPVPLSGGYFDVVIGNGNMTVTYVRILGFYY